MSKTALILIWFPVTFGMLIINLVMLALNPHVKMGMALVASPLTENYQQITASAGSGEVLSASVVAGDARGLLLNDFLNKYESPLAPYADQIVSQADQNDIDYRTLVAIAMCESNLGKRIPVKACHNGWGIAVYDSNSDQGRCFSSWPEAITWVSSYIGSYYKKGITDLREIGARWAPPTEAENHGWSSCVGGFQNSIL